MPLGSGVGVGEWGTTVPPPPDPPPPPSPPKGEGGAAARPCLNLAPMGSPLQLALQLVHEAPVRGVGNDLVGIRLDHAGLAQPQRVKAHRVLGIVLPPFCVGNFLE